MCPFVPCEYPIPIEIRSNEPFGDFDLDTIFLPDFYCSQVQVKDHDDHHVKQSESHPSTSSAGHGGGGGGGGGVAVATDRKMNHNASERDRRKKINGLYSSLRALLPSTDHMKKLSIPATVSRVLKYIPELQKEVKDLTHKKEELLLSESSFSQRNSVEFIKEKSGKIRNNNIEEKLSSKYSVSVNKMSDKEMIIQISTLERISLSEVLMQVEKGGYLIVDVSSFQSFSGRAFHTIHLLMEGINVKNYGNLNGDKMQFLIQNQRQMYF